MAEKSFGVKEINLIGASGTPTIESPNNINLTAVNVAMSNNASVAGNLSVTGTLTGNGSNLTNLPAANLTGTLPAISGANLTNLPAANLTGTLPAISGANLTNLPTVDPATSDIQVAYELLSTSSSSNGYRISGNGVDNTTANPDLYLVRGHKYRFINNSGGSHPFRIQSDNGSTLYSTGVTNNNASSGNIDFAPPHDAPQQLYYKCGNHPTMLGNIYIVGSFSKISVSGQSDIVVDNLSSTMTFVAGSNMTITTNAASNAVTFAASGGGGTGTISQSRLEDADLKGTTVSYVQEKIRDRRSTNLSNANLQQIDVDTYSTVNDFIAVSSSAYGGVTFDIRGSSSKTFKDTLDVGKTITIKIFRCNDSRIKSGGNSSHIIDQIRIDGDSNHHIYWKDGNTWGPSTSNQSGVEVYQFDITKISNSGGQTGGSSSQIASYIILGDYYYYS